MEEAYANIREILCELIGAKVIDITQHDRDEYDRDTESGAYLMLMFDNGKYLKCFIGEEGLEHNCGPDDE